MFRQRRRERKREGEKHQGVVASHEPPTGDLACNPGMCPDQELNRQPLGLQASAQSTESHQPGIRKYFLKFLYKIKLLWMYFLLHLILVKLRKVWGP